MCGDKCCKGGCCPTDRNACFDECSNGSSSSSGLSSSSGSVSSSGELGTDQSSSSGSSLGTDSVSSSSSSGSTSVPLCSLDSQPYCSDSTKKFECPAGTSPVCLFSPPASPVCKINSDVSARIESSQSTNKSREEIIVNGSCQNAIPLCNSNNIPTCPTGFRYTCSSSGIPTCTEVPGVPLALCNNNGVLSFGTCTQAQSFNPDINVSIITNPNFPGSIELPLVKDEFLGKVGFAFKNPSQSTNPSFEINTSLPLIDTEILSLELVGSDGTRFNNVLFSILATPDPTVSVLTLVLPPSLQEGEAVFILNKTNGEVLSGIIEVIVTDNNSPSPAIRHVFARTVRNKVTLTVKGSNFSRSRVALRENKNQKLQLNPNGSTEITIFPKSLNIEPEILQSGKNLLKLRFDLPENVTGQTLGVLIISSPGGIVSTPFAFSD